MSNVPTLHMLNIQHSGFEEYKKAFGLVNYVGLRIAIELMVNNHSRIKSFVEF